MSKEGIGFEELLRCSWPNENSVTDFMGAVIAEKGDLPLKENGFGLTEPYFSGGIEKLLLPYNVQRQTKLFIEEQRRRAHDWRLGLGWIDVTTEGRITPRRHSCNGRYRDRRNVPRSVLAARMDWYPDGLDWRTMEFERLMRGVQLYSGDPGEVVDWASLAKANADCPAPTLASVFPKDLPCQLQDLD